MEYKVFKIPKPDAVFYLNVPIPTVMKLIKGRSRKKDVHEKDVKFLENSRKSALWLAKTQKGWIKIDCMRGDKLMSREVIHEKVYEKVKKILK